MQATENENNIDTQRMPLKFTGKSGEYFKIWIVNVLLTIITFGIYYPWAKVRTHRYFYGNTQLDNHGFDYTAKPSQILKGLIVAVGLYVAYTGLSNAAPLAGTIFALLLFTMLPWIVVASLSFRFRNTVYRGLRFNFEKNYSSAVKTFAGLPILIPFTAGLIFPYYLFKRQAFIVNHAGYGSSRFELNAGAKEFYKIYLAAFLIYLLIIGGFFSMFFMFGLSQPITMMKPAVEPQLNTNLIVAFLPTFFIFLGMMFLTAYTTAKTNNHIWNNIFVDGHQFESQLKTGTLFTLYLTNALGVILSLGLLIPWARIRTVRYRVQQLAMITHESLNHFITKKQKDQSALGEQLGEIFDVDIGL